MSVLLSPLLLTVAPVSFDIPKIEYNHGTQVSSGAEENVTNATTMKTTTFNGTQTFDFNGKANDADSDTDADPY